jgi:hypothetical protein
MVHRDTLIRPKPLKADLGEHVNAQAVDGKWGGSNAIDAHNNMKTVTCMKRVAGNRCHVDLLVRLQRSDKEH